MSATLTKATQSWVIEKAGFTSKYKLMQTSLDRPEIMQMHRFIQHSKASCLDLQFILPKNTKQAKDIQKTIIFVNSVKEIRPLIQIIRAWMIKLDYPPESSNHTCPQGMVIFLAVPSDIPKVRISVTRAAQIFFRRSCLTQ